MSQTRRLICTATAVGLIATYGLVTAMDNRQREPKRESFRAQDMAAPIPRTNGRPTPTPEPEMRPEITEHIEAMKKATEQITITVEEYELESLGTYFITAYCSCSRCCGIYAHGETASGVTVHRADEFNRKREPTTAAIDPRLHGFEELIYVPSEDRIYITEDTGSAVKGHHIDLYQDDHWTVQGYNTRYEEIYSVTVTTHEEPASKYDIHHFFIPREVAQQ